MNSANGRLCVVLCVVLFSVVLFIFVCVRFRFTGGFRCGKVNATGQKFCGDCGTKLSKKCPSCGKENDMNQKFCGDCGTKL